MNNYQTSVLLFTFIGYQIYIFSKNIVVDDLHCTSISSQKDICKQFRHKNRGINSDEWSKLQSLDLQAARLSDIDKLKD